jgi:hypothetical protein
VTPDELAALTNRPDPGPHRTTVEIAGASIMTLADLPPLRDKLLFVGLNPSPVSVDAGHYLQGRIGRRFWQRLMHTGIIPAATAIEAADDALIAAGHGITDLIKRPSPRDEAPDDELRAGSGRCGRRSPSGGRARSCSSTSAPPRSRLDGRSRSTGVTSRGWPSPVDRAS